MDDKGPCRCVRTASSGPAVDQRSFFGGFAGVFEVLGRTEKRRLNHDRLENGTYKHTRQ